MHHYALTLHSSIDSAFSKWMLWRGSLLALLGLFPLFLGGVFLSHHILTYAGLPLYLTAFGLIAWGMVPYKQIKKIETQPYVLHIQDDEKVILSRAGQLISSFSLNEVERLEYTKTLTRYGICVFLKGTESENTIYLPFFTLASFKRFETFLNEENS